MTKTIHLTGTEIARAIIVIEKSKVKLTGLDLATALVKNKRILQAELDVPQRASESEILKTYHSQVQQALAEAGGSMSTDGSLHFKDTDGMKRFLKEQETLLTSDVKAEQKRIQEISAAWEKKEFDLELHTVKQEDLPSDISVEVYEALLPFIE